MNLGRLVCATSSRLLAAVMLQTASVRAAEADAGPMLEIGRESDRYVWTSMLPNAGIRLAWMRPATTWLSLPEDFRNRPVPAREVAEAMAASRGLRIVWLGPAHGVIQRDPPDEDVARLARDLEDPDLRTRVDAAWRARFVYDARVPGLLARAMMADEADEDVLHYAAGSLSRMGLPVWGDDSPSWEHSVGWGIALLGEPRLVRTADELRRWISLMGSQPGGPIQAGIGWRGGESARELLEPMFRVPPHMSSSATDEIIALFKIPGASEILERNVLHRGDAHLFSVAYLALILDHPDAQIRLDTMLGGLGERERAMMRANLTNVVHNGGGSAALDWLRSTIRVEPSSRFARAFAEAMASAGLGEEAFDALGGRLDRTPPETDAVNLLHALGATGSPKAFAVIAPYLESDSMQVRGAAMQAMAKLGGREWEAHLIEELRGDRRESWHYAAQALGILGTPEAVEALVGTLDPQWEHRRGVASRAIAHLVSRRPWAEAHALAERAFLAIGHREGQILSALTQGEEPEALAMRTEALADLTFGLHDPRRYRDLITMEAIPHLIRLSRLPPPPPLPEDPPGRVVVRVPRDDSMDRQRIPWACDLLSRIGGPRVLEELVQEYRNAEQDWHRATLLDTFRKEGSPMARRLAESVAREGM